MPASLRDLTRKPVSRRTLWAAVERALRGGDDVRSGVLLTTSLLERGLERLIRSRLHRLNSQDDSAIFGAKGSLGTLSAKIRMAYALGLIGKVVRSDLLAINEIRNVYAHSPLAKPLSRQAMRQKCLSIRMFSIVYSSKPKHDYEERTPAGALVKAIGMYAVFFGSDRHKRSPPPRRPSTFLGIPGRFILQ